VTPPTQQFGLLSQTNTVPKLLSAYPDGVVDSAQLSVCLMVLMSVSDLPVLVGQQIVILIHYYPVPVE